MEISSKDCSSKELYKLLAGIVVPRPIAFVSTKSPQGVHNVAPFSFFNGITSNPPTVMFVSADRKGKKKDTLNNIIAHSQFVINVVNEEIAQEMHNTSVDYRADVSEFTEVGLTPIPAQTIDCMAVKESPVHMECKLDQIIRVGDSDMVLGEVLHFHIDDRIYLGNYKINTTELKPLGRLSGNYYGRMRELFELEQQFDADKLRE